MTAMVPTRINGRWTLLLPDHRQLQHTTNPYWEKPRLDSMFANLRAGDVVYDVGTEEGDLSALFATWVGGPKQHRLIQHAAQHCLSVGAVHMNCIDCGRCFEPGAEIDHAEAVTGGIVLLEPNERVWPNVKAIWEANDLPAPLGCWTGFAGDCEPRGGDLRKDGWPDSADGPLIGDHGFANLCERDDLPCTTLTEIARQTRPPDAITIDVEGSELHVLHGAYSTLVTHRPLVWVSIHPDFMRDMYQQTPDDLVSYMQSLGYQREHLAAEHEWHTLFWHPEGRTPVLPYGGAR